MKKPTPGMIGEKHGRLTAVAKLTKGKWQWRCECGQLKAVNLSEVRCGNTKSCGCLLREHARRQAAALLGTGKTRRRAATQRSIDVVGPVKRQADAAARAKLIEGCKVREFKPLSGHAQRLQQHRAMCEATR
jgi:hypothetical protein